MKKGFSKKGAASFYIVAFSTLILVVVAASFATLIINETMRTSNNDLSQSAYDSALAGVEDAKLAAANYRRCKISGAVASTPASGGAVTCPEIIYWVEHSTAQNPDCYMVGKILGRVPKTANSENTKDGVFIREKTENGNKLNQAYTCTTFSTSLDDYRADLSSGTPQKVIKAELDGPAKDVKYIKISWYSFRDGMKLSYSNYDENIDRVVFPPASANGTSVPPTISVQLIQTAQSFTMGQFDSSVGGATNRGMVYLVPYNKDPSNTVNNSTYKYSASNLVSKADVAASNDKVSANKPYVVKCGVNTTDEFVCSATIELPEPVGGARNNDTFMIVVGLPYEQPETDISVKFCKTNCSGTSSSVGGASVAKLKDVQIEIDSTGRANDLFRRVKTRLDLSDSGSSAYLFDALQLLGDSGNTLLKKNMTVTHQ